MSDVAAEAAAPAVDHAVPVLLDSPRVVQAEAAFDGLADQARQAALSHREQVARQEGNAA